MGRNQPISPVFEDSAFRGLWSLWDILELNARAFYAASNAMQHLLTSIENRKSVKPTPDGGVVVSLIEDAVFVRVLRENLETLEVELKVLGARITWMEASRLHNDLTSGGLTFEGLTQSCTEIRSRLADELSLTKVFVIESERQRYFQTGNPHFGADFQPKFVTDGVFELDESAKCFALSRPTACVFHLMRILELGIRALARCLGIPDPVKPAERNWGVILKAIQDGIAKKWPTAADKMKPDAILFEALHASLDAVKNPWRNATMHVENKYTDSEAEHIFIAVKGFMTKLSSRMDENGLPLA